MNKGGNENRSVRNTKRKLREALLELMKCKPINQITVMELAELADVNRGTFYFHYSDVYDMLRKIEEEFFSGLGEVLKGQFATSEEARHFMREVVTFFGDYRGFCSVMMGKNGDIRFLEQIRRMVSDRFMDFWRQGEPDKDPKLFDLYNAFVVNGCMGLLQHWLNNEGTVTPEALSIFAAGIITASAGACGLDRIVPALERDGKNERPHKGTAQ